MSISRQMGKKAVVHIHMEYYSAIKKNAFESILVRWMKLEPIIQRSQSEGKTPIQYTNAYIWNLENGNDNPVCETTKETQMYRTVFWTLWEKARVGWFVRIALKHGYYHMWNWSPVQVQYMRQGVQGWCTGMTLRDGRGVQDGEHMYTHGWFMSMYGKTLYNSLQLK